ncbi:NADP-dependent oxidoreductase [Nocardia brasiliensis]
MVRAIRYDKFGDPGVLRLVDAEMPTPGPHQIRVAVRAAGVDPFDWKLRSGVREIPDLVLPVYPGLEVAGVVDDIGPGVADVGIGDPVLGWTVRTVANAGGYAEFALCDGWTRKPGNLSWAEAAALPVAVQTADTVLRRLAPRPGETLLINGASGSVGSMAVQLARSAAVSVIGTASEANQVLVAELGARPVVYGPGVVARVRAITTRRIDAVFDVAGHEFLPAAIELRHSTDRIVTIADPAGPDLGVELSRSAALPRPGALLGIVADRLAIGYFRLPAPPRVLPLADAAKAHEIGESGSGSGKLVLEVVPGQGANQ